MRVRGLRLAAWSVLACAAGYAQIVHAHEFKLDSVINACVRIEPGQAELVVRAPLYLFKSVKFPVAGAEIDVDNSAPALERALAAIQKDITLFENDRPLVPSHATGRLSLPSDRSFETYGQAASHIAAPLERGTSIYIDQGYVDARITYPIGSPGSEFAVRTTAAPELGDALKLAPSGKWFPPFVETAIAASIVYMALENIVGVKLERRVLITGLFGLVHGFGFSYGLQENFQFAGTHLLVSLFAFNAGIELGQIMVLAAMLPALAVVRRYVLPGRLGMIILSAIMADTGWHWMIDRADVLWKTPWPRPSAAGLAILALWVAGILLAAGGLSVIAKRLRFTPGDGLPSPQRGVAD